MKKNLIFNFWVLVCLGVTAIFFSVIWPLTVAYADLHKESISIDAALTVSFVGIYLPAIAYPAIKLAKAWSVRNFEKDFNLKS